VSPFVSHTASQKQTVHLTQQEFFEELRKSKPKTAVERKEEQRQQQLF